LNVGVKDVGAGPISLPASNLRRCQAMAESSDTPNPEELRQAMAEARLYARLSGAAAGAMGLDVIRLFVQRLAQLIRAAGSQRQVVLSSTWRQPQHMKKAQELEKVIATELGEPFVFDARTPLAEDRTAAGRLKGIHSFIREHCASSTSRTLRVLVLEDFHITAMGTWHVDGKCISSEADAEEYLMSNLPSHMTVTSKLLHTYDEWRAGATLQVQVGSGLTVKHFVRGMDFLNPSDDFDEPAGGGWKRGVTEPAGGGRFGFAGGAVKFKEKETEEDELEDDDFASASVPWARGVTEGR